MTTKIKTGRESNATLSVKRYTSPSLRSLGSEDSSWGNSSLVTAQDMLKYAQTRVVRLTRLGQGWDGAEAKPVSKTIAAATVQILSRLLTFSNPATPQVTPEPDGGVTVEWLVSGDQIGFSMRPTHLTVWGEYQDGGDMFPPFEATPGDIDTKMDALESTLAEASIYLQKLSGGVEHRITIR